jgi:2-dehydro-3-deoxy-L-rhamnonate dehydrogenase (NAD+)
MNKIDLSGRHAIVTGGSSGIGLATARRFLQSGAQVCIWGRSEPKLDEALKLLTPLGPVQARSVDVSDATKVDAAASDFIASHGQIDILFNCAGAAQETKPLSQISSEEWHSCISANLDSSFYCCKAVIPQMVAQNYGRIINTSSMAGKEGNAYQAAYASAKAGVIALTKVLGKELSETGVLVNCIVPTLFETPMADAVVSGAPEVMAVLRDKIPMKRFGDPDEAAAMVAWLASEECSFSTGFAFDLSGGRATY